MTAQMSARAWLGVGSNLGDREAQIAAAVAALNDSEGITVMRVSRLVQTEPVGGPPGQPMFVNGVIEAETRLDPTALLATCLRIEREMGRDRAAAVRWGPREIDLDILLIEDRVIDVDGLRVPHPRLHERLFVLEPLAELVPNLRHPTLGRSIEWLLRACRQAEPVVPVTPTEPRTGDR